MKLRRNYLKEMFPEKAYQLQGDKDENLRQHLLEGTLSTQKLLEASHKYNATIGVFLTSLYIKAILQEMPVHERRRKIIVSLPVNLRQYFPSSTTRNFFSAVQIIFNPEKFDGTLESVIAEVKRLFAENLSEERIFATMNSYAALEHNYAIKMTPLFLKYIAIRSFNYWMKRGVTTSLSNVGKVDIPKKMEPYVDKFVSFMAGRTAFICISTFKDRTVVGVATCFTNHEVFRHLFRELIRQGIPVELATNDYDVEEG
ncbi:MAG: hypothetical protein HUJ73_08010 [Eubacterium sp.]|nr:hypothetical protein [Eubacterium sp.]